MQKTDNDKDDDAGLKDVGALWLCASHICLFMLENKSILKQA